MLAFFAIHAYIPHRYDSLLTCARACNYLCVYFCVIKRLPMDDGGASMPMSELLQRAELEASAEHTAQVSADTLTVYGVSLLLYLSMNQWRR